MGVFPNSIRSFFKRKLVRYGMPFFVLLVGGSFGLREFTQLRYQFRNVSAVSREEAEKMGIKMKKPGEVTLDSIYEEIKTMDIDNWEQVRGPRPWEEKDESQN